MPQPAHFTTTQLSGIVLKLRLNLSIGVREFGGELVYIIEDELKSQYYRVGQAEYTFISLLDGSHTFADALGQTAAVMRADALNESEAAALCRWLVDAGLASTPQSSQSARLLEATQELVRKKLRSRLNPIFFKQPLCNPDRFLTVAARYLSWMFSWPCFIMWSVIIAIALLCVSMKWQQATTSTTNIISQFNWAWLLFTWLGLKLVHETAHGVASKKYGAAAREAGALLILFIPLPYIDVTSAWRLSSRWHRVVISLAGMYVELFVAALATLVWYSTDSEIIRQHAFNVMLTASVISVLFNANPLMRFDGYYALVDWIEMPNLASHGQQSMLNLGRRMFLGLNSPDKDWPEGRHWLIFCYGAAALLWRVVICFGLTLAADAMYFGAGIAIAAFAILTWVILPVFKLLKFVAFGSEKERPKRLQFVCVCSVLFLLCTGICHLPWHECVEAPAVIDYHPLVEVRSSVPGFVEQIYVKAGQEIEKGEAIVRLSNPELEIERRQLGDELAQSQQRQRMHQSDEQIASWQAECTVESSLRKRLLQLDLQLEQLTIAAPAKGIILDSSLESLEGSYVKTGDLLTHLGSESSCKLLALISEQDVDRFSKRIKQSISLHIDGNGTKFEPGLLSSIEPRATTKIPHHAFASTSGGELNVRIAETPQASSTTDDNESNGTRHELTAPRFLATISMPPHNYRAGRQGFISVRCNERIVGDVIVSWMNNLLEKRQQR